MISLSIPITVFESSTYCNQKKTRKYYMNYKPQQLSEFLQINKKNQTFLNVIVIENSYLKDSKRFIFPSYLENARVDGFDSVTAVNSITSFFNQFLTIINSTLPPKQINNKIEDLFSPIHEIDSTGIGYAEHNNKGHGPNYEALLQLGELLNTIISNIHQDNNIDPLLVAKSLPIFKPDFGLDALSDLLTVLIYPLLLDYTEYVLKKNKINYSRHNIPTTMGRSQRKTWDPKKAEWAPHFEQIVVKEIPVTLLPSDILIGHTNTLNPSRFVLVFLINQLKKNNEEISKAINTAGSKRKYMKGKSVKKFALKNASKAPFALTEFLQDPKNKGIGMRLKDIDDIN